MSKYYVTNENGDWWIMDSDSKLYILPINDPQLENVSKDDIEQDKWEDTIRELGISIHNFTERVIN
jgi:hypothetical protein